MSRLCLVARHLRHTPSRCVSRPNASAQEIAGIGRADAVLAVTDDAAVNLEIALVGKDANPSVRVVARALIMILPAGWNVACSSVPRVASPCSRPLPRQHSAGAAT